MYKLSNIKQGRRNCKLYKTQIQSRGINAMVVVALVKIFIFLIGTLQIICAGKRNVSIITEETIYDDIFASYNAEIQAHGRPLKVEYDMNVQAIHSLDVKTQILTMTAFTFMRWHDSRLQWNSSDYNDIDALTVGNNIVWTPDVVLYNDAQEQPQSHLDVYRSKVLIRSSGQVIWSTPVKWKATCSVDVTWFPVDMQICNMTFGSWSYANKVIDLKFRNKEMTTETLKTVYHVPSGEWIMKAINFYEEDTSFQCCKHPFSTITLSLELVRYPKFYYIYVFLPFISQLLLFLLIFHIQPEHGDRLSYGVALLLNMTMYMIFLSDKLPEKSDNQPFVGTLFVTLFFMLSLGLGLSAVTMMLSRKETPVPEYANKMKKLIHNILSKIRNLFGCCSNGRDSRKPGSTRHASYNIHPTTENDDQGVTLNGCGNGSPDSNSTTPETLVLDPHQHRVEDDYKEFEGWSDFARYMDKCMFYVFLFLVFFVPLIIAVSLDPSKKG